MEKLIKLQSIVMLIESDIENEFKSEFNFISDKKIEIETPFWQRTMLIKEICDATYYLIGYVESNTKLIVLEMEE